MSQEEIFDDIYRYPFEEALEIKRSIFWIDKHYLLCHFDSLVNIQNENGYLKYKPYKSTIVVSLNITALQHFIAGFDKVWLLATLEETAKGPYCYEGEYGDIRRLCYWYEEVYEDMKEDRDCYPKKTVLCLLIKESELPLIKSMIANRDSVLIDYNRFNKTLSNYANSLVGKDTLYGTHFYPYGEYNLSKLYTIDHILHVYDSLIEDKFNYNKNFYSNCQ